MATQRCVNVHVIKARACEPINKAETATQVAAVKEGSASQWITPSIDMRGLKAMVSHSTILPQCIRAYKNNIAGFGIAIDYKEDYKGEETAEMKSEWDRADEALSLLNMDCDTKEVFEDVIEARETYGISYTEVVRNVGGEIVSIEFIRDTPSINKTAPLDPYIDVEYFINEKSVKRPRRFCKYRQQIGGKTVYFKEIGDPRLMDKISGEYVADGGTLDIAHRANEIMEFAIGTETYGEVRWIGQTLGVDGSRKAENLNNRYFEEGRHTPLLIMVKGGKLTPDSFTELQKYMDGIKGEAGQHAFMLLEMENIENRAAFEGEKPPEIEVVPLASILQHDELFQNYLDNNRRKIQSSFLLPDLYVGYTTDFNRATAQTAMEVTEKQVFQPERQSIAWAINNKLLSSYRFKYIEARFKAPDITNPEDITKILTVAERAGGLPPNKAKEIAYKVLGQIAENYAGDWGEIPLAISRSQIGSNSPPASVSAQLEDKIKKAATDGNDAVVAVMKEVRSLLLKMQEGDAA